MQGNDISTQILGWTNHQGLNYRKKVQNCTLGCSVQCRGMLCCDSLLLGGSQSPGALFTKWQDCLEWEQLLPYAGGRAVLLQPGWGRWFFFFLYFCIFKMGWKDLKRSADCHRAWATTSRVTWAPWSPENGTSLLPTKFSCQSKCEAKSPCTISGRKHVLWGQLWTKLQLQNAFWRSLSSLQRRWRVHKDHCPCPGEVHTTTVLPVLYHFPSCTDGYN